MKWNQSNAAAKLEVFEPQFAFEASGAGTWELRPVSGEHLLSARRRELLGMESDEAIAIQRLLAPMRPDDSDRCKESIAQVLDADRGRKCHLEFRTAGPSERWMA